MNRPTTIVAIWIKKPFQVCKTSCGAWTSRTYRPSLTVAKDCIPRAYERECVDNAIKKLYRGERVEAHGTLQSRVASDSVLRSGERHFYLWMAGVFVLIAFGGFTPTYWAPLAGGTFKGPPILHIHGALLFSWTLFYFVQTAWVASGRTPTHRAWGLAGIALFSVMMCSILVTKITVMRLDDAHGYGDAGRRFAAVPLFGLPVLIGIFSLAIANVRRPETHKRLMYLVMVGFMHPAIARVALTLFAPAGTQGPPPVFVAVPPALIADLLIIVALIYDWRTRGRPHQVYVYGGLTLLADQLLTVPVSSTQTWMSIASFLEGLAG
jgi:hypothetical protein